MSSWFQLTRVEPCRASDGASEGASDVAALPSPAAVRSSLPPGAVCHVAYVDVRANPNPNELARQAADETPRDFKCGKDPIRIMGARGRAVELASP